MHKCKDEKNEYFLISKGAKVDSEAFKLKYQHYREDNKVEKGHNDEE